MLGRDPRADLVLARRLARASLAADLNPTAFGKRMTALGYERAKIGGVMRYEGVALTVSRQVPLRVAVDNTSTPSGRALGKMVTVGFASAARS